jgi:transcriptional regulator with XRE-family HTH domain
MDLRQARQARGWSQEELAERTGLSVRTIQRIETGGRPGLSSARLLAEELGLDVAELTASSPGVERDEPRWDDTPAVVAVREGVRRFADFEGRASRADYWWLFLAFALVTGAASALSEALGAALAVLLSLPLVAAGARRLHDIGHSGWWQLFALAPLGFVVPLTLLVQPTDEKAARRRAAAGADLHDEDALSKGGTSA